MTETESNSNLGLLKSGIEQVLSIIQLNQPMKLHKLSEFLGSVNVTCFSATHLLNGKELQLSVVADQDGEIEIYSCDNCGSVRSREATPVELPHSLAKILPHKLVKTPNCKTIEEVTQYLGMKENQTMKAVFFNSEKSLLLVLIRGDLEVNEQKVMKVIGATNLTRAETEDILAVGAIPGYASPVGLDQEKCTILSDYSVLNSSNLVGGANKEGYHFLNLNVERDFKPDIVSDIAMANQYTNCQCDHTLTISKAFIITRSEMIVNKTYRFMNREGKNEQIQIQKTNIFMMRLVGLIIDRNFDANGIIIPLMVAPIQCIIIDLKKKEDEVLGMLTRRLDTFGITHLVDNRKVKPGVKFNEADLRGFRFSIVISSKLGKQIELRDRLGKVMVMEINNLSPTSFIS